MGGLLGGGGGGQRVCWPHPLKLFGGLGPHWPPQKVFVCVGGGEVLCVGGGGGAGNKIVF